MPAPHIDNDHASPPHSGSTSFDSRLAHIRAKTDTGLTLISISGEIDASNVDDVSHHVRELASDCGALIVDLAEVDFIALDGLHALIALNDQCARTGTTWALIASHAVNQLLRVGDRDTLLPAVGSATEALPTRSFETLVTRLFRYAAVGLADRRHGIASAHFICPSKLSEVAIAR